MSFVNYHLRMHMMAAMGIIKFSKELRIVYSKSRMVGCYLIIKQTEFEDDLVQMMKRMKKCKIGMAFSSIYTNEQLNRL